MAECKDCVHNKVCAEVNSLKCRKYFIWYDAKSGCPYYTADVVPKSEVEKIFEEIEKIIDEKYNHYVFGDNDLDSIEQDAIINFSDDLSDCFAELKKKYTGEKRMS